MFFAVKESCTQFTFYNTFVQQCNVVPKDLMKNRGKDQSEPAWRKLEALVWSQAQKEGPSVRTLWPGFATSSSHVPTTYGKNLGAHLHAQHWHWNQTPTVHRAWILFFSGTAQGVSPRLSATTLEFIRVDESVSSL